MVLRPKSVQRSIQESSQPWRGAAKDSSLPTRAKCETFHRTWRLHYQPQYNARIWLGALGSPHVLAARVALSPSLQRVPSLAVFLGLTTANAAGDLACQLTSYQVTSSRYWAVRLNVGAGRVASFQWLSTLGHAPQQPCPPVSLRKPLHFTLLFSQGRYTLFGPELEPLSSVDAQRLLAPLASSTRSFLAIAGSTESRVLPYPDAGATAAPCMVRTLQGYAFASCFPAASTAEIAGGACSPPSPLASGEDEDGGATEAWPSTPTSSTSAESLRSPGLPQLARKAAVALLDTSDLRASFLHAWRELFCIGRTRAAERWAWLLAHRPSWRFFFHAQEFRQMPLPVPLASELLADQTCPNVLIWDLAAKTLFVLAESRLTPCSLDLG